MVDVSDVRIEMERADALTVRRWVTANVEGRTVTGHGGTAVEALAAAMYAITVGADDAFIDHHGEPVVIGARSGSRPALAVE